ncbi:hypothetical protein VTN02DRAFT_6399 [Thermoascus thermophilus]
MPAAEPFWTKRSLWRFDLPVPGRCSTFDLRSPEPHGGGSHQGTGLSVSLAVGQHQCFIRALQCNSNTVHLLNLIPLVAMLLRIRRVFTNPPPSPLSPEDIGTTISSVDVRPLESFSPNFFQKPSLRSILVSVDPSKAVP